ncbi:MAG: TonB-dependent receptor domain-containing protein [Bryobacteraceae bacterium]
MLEGVLKRQEAEVGELPGDVSPDLSFSNAWARGPLDNSPAPPVGAEFIALLAGIPGGSLSRTGTYAEQDIYTALYFQDDWKLTRKLTLNLGLRAEHESPITERFNRSVTQFDDTSPNPIEAAAAVNYAKAPIPELPLQNFRVLGGVTFAGVGGNPREYWRGQGIQWSPRFGLAYQWTAATVFRAGYGIFYAPMGVLRTNSILSGFSRSTPIVATNDSGLTWIADLANPLPGGLLPVLGASDGLKTTLGQGTTFFPLARKMPPTHRYSFGFQRQLPGGIMVEASYVGSRSYRLPVSRAASFYAPAILQHATLPRQSDH